MSQSIPKILHNERVCSIFTKLKSPEFDTNGDGWHAPESKLYCTSFNQFKLINQQSINGSPGLLA